MVFNRLTLIFIHSAGSSPVVWHIWLKHFKGNAIAIELPGHPTRYGCTTIEDCAKAVEKQIKENHVTRPIPVGHSMGGAVPIELALRNSDLAGLILVGTGARLKVHQDIPSKLRENYSEACGLVAQWSVATTHDPTTVDSIAREMLKINPEVTYGDFIACDRFDRMKEVEGIHCPTLILWGADDRLTPLKYSQYLHERIPGSRLVVIPGAGHSVMLEKYSEFGDAIATFLTSLLVSVSAALI